MQGGKTVRYFTLDMPVYEFSTNYSNDSSHAFFLYLPDRGDRSPKVEWNKDLVDYLIFKLYGVPVLKEPECIPSYQVTGWTNLDMWRNAEAYRLSFAWFRTGSSGHVTGSTVIYPTPKRTGLELLHEWLWEPLPRTSIDLIITGEGNQTNGVLARKRTEVAEEDVPTYGLYLEKMAPGIRMLSTGHLPLSKPGEARFQLMARYDEIYRELKLFVSNYQSWRENIPDTWYTPMLCITKEDGTKIWTKLTRNFFLTHNLADLVALATTLHGFTDLSPSECSTLIVTWLHAARLVFFGGEAFKSPKTLYRLSPILVEYLTSITTDEGRSVFADLSKTMLEVSYVEASSLLPTVDGFELRPHMGSDDSLKKISCKDFLNTWSLAHVQLGYPQIDLKRPTREFFDRLLEVRNV